MAIHQKLINPKEIKFDIASTKFRENEDGDYIIEYDFQTVSQAGKASEHTATCHFDKNKEIISATYS